MSATTASPARPGLSLWILLGLASLVMTLAMGLRQSLGLFQTPLGTLGISASTFGFALALQNIVWGASQPFVGALADRFGPRPVLVGTALTYAAGLLIMGEAGGAVGLGLGAGLLVGVVVAGTGFGVLLGVVSRAVPEHRRSRTVGAVAATGSLGTALLAPLAQGLIGASGWRIAILVFAAIALVMAVLCLGIVERRAPAVTTASSDETLGQVLRQAMTHPGFL
ncbi:MAG: MFS transporter, partial [Rhodospirillales bacterium]|nr:MFS transporter [Rhodospirillales bacterium]